ncbi:MAG: acylphosphatase [Saccharospirillaceae bacterium]|nr:acylphosphatase [Pseudomonadales bacterium]NRB78891.1 acylphosphatase [Saccharospirillaceae bacterium]
MKNIQVIISGKVQGVWFRQSTMECALSLGLVGYAHNLSNATVKVQACGKQKDINSLIEFLRQGPDLARVDNIVVQDCNEPVPLDFSVG